MDHIDIELSESDGSILICTDEGELIEMHVPPKRDSVVAAIAERPPSSITVTGGESAESERLLEALKSLGHDASLAADIGLR